MIAEAMEDAVVLPTMTVGGTDNKYLRERGIPAYGFVPVLLSADEAAGFHGNNEKLSIESLRLRFHSPLGETPAITVLRSESAGSEFAAAAG